MIGSAIAAAVCVATFITANAIGVSGIPAFCPSSLPICLSFALCMVIAIVVPFCADRQRRQIGKRIA